MDDSSFHTCPWSDRCYACYPMTVRDWTAQGIIGAIALLSFVLGMVLFG